MLFYNLSEEPNVDTFLLFNEVRRAIHLFSWNWPSRQSYGVILSLQSVMLQAYCCSMIKLKLCFDRSVIGRTIRATLTSNSLGVVNLISNDGVS